MTFIDFFAGIGGMRLGLEKAGHTCLGFCEYDKYAVHSYTAIHLTTEEEKQDLLSVAGLGFDRDYKAGQKYIKQINPNEREWYANDIRAINASDIPRADCWCFGFPCQDISVAGKCTGLQGNRSGLFYAVTKLIRDLKKEDRPQYLLIENVKNLLSINRGFDFLRILVELDEIGYDAEWDVLNSAEVIPQNRERVFIIGHLRGRSTRKVFPVRAGDTQNTQLQGQSFNCLTVGGGHTVGTYVIESEQHEETPRLKQIIGGAQGNRVYDPNGLSCALSSQGGGQGAKTGLYAVPVILQKPRGNNKGGLHNIAPTLTSNCYQENNVLIMPVYEEIDGVWYEMDAYGFKIRKLTPRECFRLQTIPNELFNLAQAVNSDSQLYKQAGNAVTSEVLYRLGLRREVT